MPQTARTSDDYWTPKWVFDALNITFDLDVACPPEGPAHTPCRAYYTQETNGLTSPWHGNVWMNPPFSKLSPWVNKFIEHANGIALLPFSKSIWFHTIWESNAAIVAIPRQRAAFVQGDIFMPCFLAAYGQHNIEALTNIGRVR